MPGRREINAEVDDLISDFEAWKTEQLLKLQSQQAEILESSAAAKEELAADLDKLHEKINHYEAEVARLTEGLGAAEREVHLAQMELENARAAAEESLRLADLASTAFQPQVRAYALLPDHASQAGSTTGMLLQQHQTPPTSHRHMACRHGTAADDAQLLP